MEYERKFRWANYRSSKCKTYLRNDFLFTCAYCRLHEEETGFANSDYFEVDHFIPKADLKYSSKVHLFENLYYSCKKCNSAKGEFLSDELLDPCRDYIFSGKNPPITGGDSLNNFIFTYSNSKGELYINTFKLNSRVSVDIRRARHKHVCNMNKKRSYLNLIKGGICDKITDNGALLVLLDGLYALELTKSCTYSNGEEFENVIKLLNAQGIDGKLVFDEYNMDIFVTINSVDIYCEIIVDNTSTVKSEYKKFIESDKIKTWVNKLKYQFGILYCFPKLGKIYLYPLSITFDECSMSTLKKKIMITLTKEHLL
ncbi:MAG: HNH endonuclease [Oscillospiraceae bacterium]|nr:HNH endonuclease [Oscillospiraceae bacterium]MCL2278478.1 HNH endonuclease [Oscillospiraceae bacterium]